MQDRPSAPELLDAMAAQLFTEVREWVSSDRRFQILVLANLCAVIARELRAGEEPTLGDIALFRELLGGERDLHSAPSDSGPPDAEAREIAARLATSIRAGDLDDELPLVINRLREHVRRKLDVARPGYAD